MKKSENINEIAKSMAAFQGQMKPAIKDSKNPFFKSRYSNLESIWEAIREPLYKNEITAVQDVCTTENGISISTTLIHSSGQWLEFGPLEIPVLKKDPQSIGSAISYGKRYALCAACGVVSSDEDDDAEKAMNRPKQEQNPVKKKTIGKEKWTELNKLIDQCSPPFQQKIWDRLAAMGIQDFSDIDEETYFKMRESCLQNISKQESK